MTQLKQISYPKIPQFRNVITAISKTSSFKGMDVNNNPIYDGTAPKPIIKFKGTVKVHGTNAGICYNTKDGMYTQSRNNPYDMDEMPDSHMGFTFFVKKNKETFMRFFNKILVDAGVSPNDVTVTIYGEWAGKGIQKNVAVSELDKAFYLFGVKISKKEDPEFNSYWVDYTPYRSDENRIFNIDDFGTFEVAVNFKMPELASTQFSDITMEVEKECPVGKFFGVSGIGEGVVWTAEHGGSLHRFKVKGKEHSVSKVKTLAPVDVEKLTNIKEFVEYAVTDNRFDQSIKEVFGEDEPVIQKMGDVIRWNINDIMSEEIDTMAKNNLEPKDVNKYISTDVKDRFVNYLNNKAGV